MAVYYMATNGNNANTGSSISPWLTFSRAFSTVVAGDTLYLRGGLYGQQLNSNVLTFPVGSSWSNVVTIANAPGESATLINGQEVINLAHSYLQYLVIDGLIIDGVNSNFCIGTTNGANHVRFLDMEVKNSNDSGILITPGSMAAPYETFMEFINLDLHDCGVAPTNAPIGHGIYIANSRNIVKGCHIHHNASFGVHIFSSIGLNPSNNEVIGNTVNNNSTVAATSAGILLSSGDDNIAYNNVIYNNPTGIDIFNNSPERSKAYNNTVYNCVTGIWARNLSIDADIRNNIAYQNSFANILDEGSGTTQSNNLTTDPSFTNAGSNDFHLQSGSAAIDAGTTLVAVAIDFDNNARPQGANYDIGAYEFLSGVNPPPVIAYPTSQSINENVKTAISGTISGTNVVSVEFSVDHGQLSVIGSGAAVVS